MTTRFKPGDPVRVRFAAPPGHVRTPFFIRGQAGVVTEIMGAYRNPEELAYGRPGNPKIPLYRVRFRQTEIWTDYDGPAADSTVVDIYEHWLEADGSDA